MNSTKTQVRTGVEALEQVQRRAVKLAESPEGKSYEKLMKDKESRGKGYCIYPFGTGNISSCIPNA